MPPSPTTSTSMPPHPPLPLPPLTLIVATTPTLGIGFRGALPWPPLKADLAFFARVTKRPPPSSPFLRPGHRQQQQHEPSTTTTTRNAVIMGRKTWDSLPEKARPLRGRWNVVVSRKGRGKEGEQQEEEGVFRVGGIEEGLRMLQQQQGALGSDGKGEDMKDTTTDTPEQQQHRLGRVFVIGGADIYELALGMECCERILWTRVRGEWECDVGFPGGVLLPFDASGEVEKEGDGGGVEGSEQGEKGKWVRRSREEMERWVGEGGVGGVRREGEVEFEVFMFERVR